MGCSVGPCGTDHCFDGQIREMADTLVSSGMKDLGYEWVTLDDCWHPSRDDNDTLVPFPRFFPDGMQPVIQYVHSKGLKFGLYTSVGDRTCHGGWSPGSYGYYEKDANTFAEWGVDYVKIDYCGDHASVEGHRNMSIALNKTGRPMSYMLCRGPYQSQDHWGYAPEIAQGWRATRDHNDAFYSTMHQVNSVKGKGSWSGPYGWHYLDMMMTGGAGCKDQGTGGTSDKGIWNWTVPKHCPGMTDNEYRTEASLYVVVSSPMMIGTDIRLMTPIMRELLLNNEAIAINQDYKAPPGDAMPACPAPPPPAPVEVCHVELESQSSHKKKCEKEGTFGCINGTSKMWTDGGCRGTFVCNGVEIYAYDDFGDSHHEWSCEEVAPEAWVRKLSDGDWAVALPYLSNEPGELSLCLKTIGWPYGNMAHARDVWKKEDLGSFSEYITFQMEPHDTVLLRLSPTTRLV